LIYPIREAGDTGTGLTNPICQAAKPDAYDRRIMQPYRRALRANKGLFVAASD